MKFAGFSPDSSQRAVEPVAGLEDKKHPKTDIPGVVAEPIKIGEIKIGEETTVIFRKHSGPGR
ncbi:hypothetical protein HY090_01790 [Candidatus Kaiserbacteria bacterium]|nr:hypothetical protein [Candidatus Kaiserbacteria bacterium]